MAYLEDGNCEISNNLAQNRIRSFTVGIKNWLLNNRNNLGSHFGCHYCLLLDCTFLQYLLDNKKVRCLKDINPIKDRVKKFNDILLSEKEYECNLVVCRAIDLGDTWYLATNININIYFQSI